MTAAIGHPTLRLIRWRIGDWTLEELAPGQWREVITAAPDRRPNARQYHDYPQSHRRISSR